MKYDRNLPENFDWNSLDGVGSRTICNLAYTLSESVKADLKTKERTYTPGLRFALNALYDEYALLNS